MSKPKHLGKGAVNIILINTVVPFLFVYGKYKGKNILQKRAIELLESIHAEKNAIINLWREMDIRPINAFESQALIQLKNNYCNQKHP